LSIVEVDVLSKVFFRGELSFGCEYFFSPGKIVVGNSAKEEKQKGSHELAKSYIVLIKRGGKKHI
jgi:hypothetical protein